MARIIIADDDPDIVEVVRAALEARGHIVGALGDGAPVKAVVENKRPDLIILDCSMPNVSGVQALREIRLSRASGTPVLMLTARRSMADEEIALRAGADDYLRKPFDPDQLVARVETLLEQHKSDMASSVGRR